MIRSLAIILSVLNVVVLGAQSTPPVAKIYSDFSEDQNVQNQCQIGCKICLDAIDSSAIYSSLARDTGLSAFLKAYKQYPGSNNSNSFDGYTIFSGARFQTTKNDELAYGITNGWDLYGIPSTGPIIDGSAPTIGDSYSWLNGQFYHVHLDHVDTSKHEAVLWARSRSTRIPVYASSAIRTPKCTFWDMQGTVYPPARGDLFNALRTWNCSNWGNLLARTQCNGMSALAMFSEGTLFALPDSLFDASTFNIGAWGYNNGDNNATGWCNMINYYSSLAALPLKNASTSGSTSTRYSANNAVQTIDYAYSIDYNLNNSGSAEAEMLFNGHAKSVYGSIPIWLNDKNGSTFNVLSDILDPKNKVPPKPNPKPVNPDNTTTSSGPTSDSHMTVISGYFTLVILSISTMAAMFVL